MGITIDQWNRRINTDEDHTVTYGIAGTYEIADGRSPDTDHIAGISRDRMDKRKTAPPKEAKPKSTKTKIHFGCEYYQGKAAYPRIREKRKSPTTQDPHDNLRICQHQIMLNERAIQARWENSRESKGT
jgi:hypothetical protein